MIERQERGLFWAINKRTGERVRSFQVYADPRYQLPKEDEWIADPDEISNWAEIKEKIPEPKVVYVKDKKYTNYQGTPISSAPHFRVLNAKKLGINVVPESKEHKLAKNWIFNQIQRNQLKIYYSVKTKTKEAILPQPINLFNIDVANINIEERINSAKKLRIADVFVPFLIEHPVLGKGIVFEIQFSRQKKYVEERRTLEWALKGMSSVWLHLEDFEKISEIHIELKDNQLKIDSWLETLHYEKRRFAGNLVHKVQDQCLKLDKELKIMFEKMEEFEEEFNKQIESDVEDYIDQLREEKIKIVTEINKLPLKVLDRNDDQIKEIGSLHEFYPKTKSHLLQLERVFILSQERIIKEQNDKISILNSQMDYLDNKFKNLYDKARLICPKCGGVMVERTGKFGKFYGCSNYPDCKKIINCK